MPDHAEKPKRPSKSETRQSLNLFSLNAGYEGVFVTICGGNTLVFVAFALSIGIPKERMGLVTALVSAACVVQMLALPLIGKVKDKKACILRLAVMEPLMFILSISVLPFIEKEFQIYAFGAAIFLAAGFANMARTLTSEWMASVIPAGI
jgi:hypothetical protein